MVVERQRASKGHNNQYGVSSMKLSCPSCSSPDLKEMKNSDTGEFWVACDRCGKVMPVSNTPQGALQNTYLLQLEVCSGFKGRLEELKGHLGEVSDPKALPLVNTKLALINQVLTSGPQEAPQAWIMLCSHCPGLARRI